jgi:putative lipoprotein
MNRFAQLLPIAVAACTLAGCRNPAVAPAPVYAITGTVACREAAPLPPDAVLEIQLLDFASPEGPSELLNSVTVSPLDRWPVSYRLGYDPALIRPNHIYTLRARIMAGGRIRFINATAVRVLTFGFPAERNLMLDSTAER